MIKSECTKTVYKDSKVSNIDTKTHKLTYVGKEIKSYKYERLTKKEEWKRSWYS